MALIIGFAQPSYAHDPFESTLTGDFCNDQLIAKLATNYQNYEPILKKPLDLAEGVVVELPPKQALALLRVNVEGTPVEPTNFTVELAPPEDVLFRFSYAVPDARGSTVKANILPTLHYDHTLVTRLTRCDQNLPNGFRVLYQGYETLNFMADAPDESLWQVIATFFHHGFMHLVQGVDHLIFLLAILLVSVHWRRALLLISAFTLAHSITLATSVLGWVANPAWVEPMIAISIMIMSLEVIASSKTKFASSISALSSDSAFKAKILILARSPKFQFGVVFTFGLIHGLGFARAFAALQGEQNAQWIVALASFNIAIEFAQVVALALCYPLLSLLRKMPMYNLIKIIFGVGILFSGLFFLVNALGM